MDDKSERLLMQRQRSADNGGLADVSGGLKRSVDLPMAFSVALKQVIGGGVIVLTGTAISLTGAGATIAYAIAALAVLLVSLPYAVLGAARPVSGSLYRWPTQFIGPAAGFLGFWMVLGTHVGLAAYAATFGATLHALLPVVPAQLAGIAALVLVVVLNLLGTEISGRANIIIVLIVALSLVAFAAAGTPHIEIKRLAAILPHGWHGLIAAAALLTFPLSGATLVSELAGEMKRPARDVPIAILGTTVLAALLYVAVASVAAGVPNAATDQTTLTLNIVAQRIMGYAGAALFGIGTGMISMLGIMNTHMLWGSRSVLMVCQDGWLPRRLGVLNRRGAPHWPLLMLGAIGLVPVLLRIDVADVIRIGGLGASGSAILSIACAPLNVRHDPTAYARSPLPLHPSLLLAASALAIATQIATIVVLLRDLPSTLAGSAFTWIALGCGVAFARRSAVTTTSMP